MLQDINQVSQIQVSRLKNTHFVGLMTFTRDQFAKAFGDGKDAPRKVNDQLQRFNEAYKALDEAYKSSTYSLDTEALRQADADCDRIFMGIKKMVQAQQGFDFNPAMKAAADLMMQAIDRYDISPNEDYLGENNKLQQLLQDVSNVANLKAAANTLGLEEAYSQLGKMVDRVRDLITQREMAKAPKGAMKAARTLMEPEYRWLIAILNATALMDDDEHRFDALITTLNANVDYLKRNALPLKENIIWTDEDYDDEPDPEIDGDPMEADGETPTEA